MGGRNRNGASLWCQPADREERTAAEARMAGRVGELRQQPTLLPDDLGAWENTLARLQTKWPEAVVRMRRAEGLGEAVRQLDSRLS
jgi:hypothetical protein